MPSIDDVRDAQRKTWNKFSGGWQKWDAFVMAWLAPAGAALLELAALREASAVLDVATGTGEPGLSAARRASRGTVTAVDVAEDMVRIAEGKARAQGLANFSARAFDGLRLPFPDRAFDAVLCRHGLMFVPDMTAFARELVRAAKPGGRVAVATWQGPERNPWGAVPGRVVSRTLGLPPPPPDAPGIFRCAPPGLVRGLLEGAGLTDVVEREMVGDVVFAGPGQFWEFLGDVVAPVSAALAGADAAAREAVRTGVAAELAGFAQGPDRLVLPWAARVTAGTRP